MEKRTLLCAVLSAVALAACSTMQISSERSPGADLSQYKTYSWAPPPPGRSMDPILEKNIQAALDRSFQENGFAPAPAGTRPDFLVSYSVASETKTVVHQDGVGYGYGMQPWNGYMTSTYREGSLVVDLLDARSKAPFWRGIAVAEIPSRDQTGERAREAAQKIVAEYRNEQASKGSS